MTLLILHTASCEEPASERILAEVVQGCCIQHESAGMTFKHRGTKGHVNTRISHSGSKAQYQEDTRNPVV